MTEFATVEDVIRVLRLTNEVDEDDLQLTLDAVNSYFDQKLPAYLTPSGTQKYFGVAPGALLSLPVRGATVSVVKAFPVATAAGYTLSADTYSVTEDHVIMHGTRGLDPRAGLEPGIDEGEYQRVEIDWAYAGGIPAAVRDGVALTAGALWLQSSKIVSGTRSEKIGDYSYTLNDKDAGELMPPKAKLLLKPFLRKPQVLVT